MEQKMDIPTLVERIERLEGPDREVDREIALAVNVGERGYMLRPFTASLDSAMTLRPKGEPIAFMSVKDVYHAGIGDKDGDAEWYAVAATPALALCAAALRARAAMEAPNG